jgi:VCBS repeat protein/FG-GAP repeat protein
MAIAASVVVAVLWLPAAALAQVSFSGPTNFRVGDGPGDVVVGDFNGDSDPDLVVANTTSNDVTVLPGQPGGGFGQGTSHPAGESPRSVEVADFDGDSDPDLAVANHASDDVWVRLGGQGAGFGQATSHPVGDGPRSVAAGDFDGDSDPDLAVVTGLTEVSVSTRRSGRELRAADELLCRQGVRSDRGRRLQR